MQKLKKTALILGLFILLVLTLTGCGANVSTKLSIDNSFAGSRKIVCTVSKENVKNNFKGGVAKIDEIIKSKCPAELTYAKAEDENNYIYTFTLTFTSKEDYEAKLEKILMRKPMILFSTPNSIFIKGVRISENFNSLDILGWFKKAVEEEKLMDDVSNLWEIGETSVEYAGGLYKTSGNINLNQIEYNPINAIIFSTTQQEDGSFKREIIFDIPDTTLMNMSSEIEDYMSKRVSQDGNGVWETTDYGKKFVITFYAKSAEELASKTSIALDSTNNKISFTEDAENSNAFQTQTILDETLDCSTFVSQDGDSVNIRYIYVTNYGGKVNFVQKEQNNEWDNKYYEFNDGVLSYDDEVTTLHLKIGIKKEYLINQVNIIMKQLGNGRYERKIIFDYDSSVDIKGAEFAKKYFDSLNASHTTTTAEEDNGIVKCIISITGNIEEINEDLNKIFGEGNSITYTKQKGLLKVKKSTYMKDEINMTEMLNMANYGNAINYTLITDGNEKIKGITFESNGYKDIKSIGNDEKQFSDILTNYNVSVIYNGSVVDSFAIFLILLMILIPIILIILGIIVASKRSANNSISSKEVLINAVRSIKIHCKTIIDKSMKGLSSMRNKSSKPNTGVEVNNSIDGINASGVANRTINDKFINKTASNLSFIIKMMLLTVIVGFFMPFFTVSCGGEDYAMSFNGWTSAFGTSIDTGFSSEKINGNPIVILLLILPVIALIILTIKNGLSNVIKYITTSLFSVISFIMLLIYKGKVTEKIKNSEFGTLDLKFNFGYTLSVVVHLLIFILSLITTYFMFMKSKINITNDINNLETDNEVKD